MKILFLHNSFPEYRISFWENINKTNSLKLLITHKNLEKKLYSLEKISNNLDVEYWDTSSWRSLIKTISTYDSVVLPPTDSLLDYFISVFVVVLCNHHSIPYYYWTEMWEPPTSVQPIQRRIKNFIHKIMIISLCKGAEQCVASGSKCKQYLENNGIIDIKNKISIAYDSNSSPTPELNIDIRKKYNIPENSKIILFFGRIMKRKGIDILIKASIPILRQKDAVLLICGDGDYIEYCQSIVNEDKAVSEKIFFAGKVQPKNRAAYYKQSDLFVIPAILWKGMIDIWALTVNESLEQGTPVISTTAVGASYDLISDINGIVVEQNDINALTNAINKALFVEKLHHNRNSIIEDYNKKFSVELMASSFMKVLNKSSDL